MNFKSWLVNLLISFVIVIAGVIMDRTFFNYYDFNSYSSLILLLFFWVLLNQLFDQNEN